MNRNLTSQVFRRIGPNYGSVFIMEHFLERFFFRFYLDYRFTAISPKIRVAIRAIPAGEHAALQLVFTVRNLRRITRRRRRPSYHVRRFFFGSPRTKASETFPTARRV